jgi:hypothetical protein
LYASVFAELTATPQGLHAAFISAMTLLPPPAVRVASAALRRATPPPVCRRRLRRRRCHAFAFAAMFMCRCRHA